MLGNLYLALMGQEKGASLFQERDSGVGAEVEIQRLLMHLKIMSLQAHLSPSKAFLGSWRELWVVH